MCVYGIFGLKKGNSAIWDMVGPGGYRAKSDKPDTQRRILYDLAQRWTLTNQTHGKSRMVAARDKGVGELGRC